MSSLSSLDRLKWYERILKLSEKATKESLESICHYLMDDAISAAQAETGYLLLFNESNKPKTMIARNAEREDIASEAQHFSESIINRSIEMAAPLILDDAGAHPDFREAKSVIVGRLKSVLVLPLFFDGRAIGAIYLENRNQEAYFSPHLLEILTLFSTQGAVLLHSKLINEPLSGSLGPNQEEPGSKSQKMQDLYKQALSVSKTESSVLLLGETGTGKEVLARKIHSMSERARKNFVAINCSAIPDSLLESELFGYKKGAFTGATSDRIGLIKKADGGTLFLDEIGDLPLHMQAKLLRVLQEKSFLPVGSTTEEKSDFRLIAATHKSLEDSVSQGFFRQDLYFRINAVTFKLLPLRERLEDLLDFVQAFVEDSSKEHSKRIRGVDESAAALLLDFDWPGNIRQLQNAVQRAIVLAPETRQTLEAEDFRFLTEKEAPSELPKLSDAKEQFIKNYVKKAILIHRGNKTKAAKALGVDPKTLYRHLSDKE